MERTVLVIDDDDSFASTIEIALLSIPGVTVIALPSARAALRFFDGDAASVAAVITDLHMPHMSGFELITRIRAHEQYSNLPILVVSGDSNPETPVRLRDLGVNEFFLKPCSPMKLHRRLEMLLGLF